MIIVTHSARVVDLWSLNDEDIDMADIAHSLAFTSRFNGMTPEPLSVAAHSVWVSEYIEEHGGTFQEQLMGLLHDATEAYIGDVIKPVKDEIEPLQALESAIEQSICRRYGIACPSLNERVKTADHRAFVAEVGTLSTNSPMVRQAYGLTEADVEPKPIAEPGRRFGATTKEDFLSRFKMLRTLATLRPRLAECEVEADSGTT